MTTEILRYRIQPDRADEFAQAYTHAAALLRESPHCLGYELLHGEEEPENWLLIIRWRSTAEHLNGFRTSAQFPEFFRLVKPFFHDILEMKHYAGTPLSWSRS